MARIFIVSPFLLLSAEEEVFVLVGDVLPAVRVGDALLGLVAQRVDLVRIHGVGPVDQAGQVAGQVAVAPADVVEVLHRGDAVSLEPGNHQGGSAPKIHSPDPGGVEPVNAAYHRHPALQPDVGPHAHQLGHMAVTALKNVLHE